MSAPAPESLYAACTQCPRSCGAARDAGARGTCGEADAVRIASACLHFGEEPPLTVHGGSGTVFFTGCTLRCAFCQNYQISQQGMGAAVDEGTFVRICLGLEEHGAENINLVTGSHHIPRIARFLAAAKAAGLSVPVAWNSSAYESVRMLELLSGLVDIWLPDLKTLDAAAGKKLFGVGDYPQVAEDAIRWMLSRAPLRVQVSEKDGVQKEKLVSGTVVRHLFLPGRMDDTILTLDWLKHHADGRAYLSLMSQYTPVPFAEPPADSARRAERLSALENRLVSPAEDEGLRDLIEAFGFEHVFYQDLSDDDSWLPDFDRTQPFSAPLATPLWHWREGFV